MKSISWQRNLAVIWFAEFTSIIGFAIVIPILPFYVQELGVTDPDAITFWSGMIFSVQAITMAVMAPIWGVIADRYGRKLMLQRAMLGGAVIIGLMGFATSVEQLVILRGLQGMITGTVAASMTLVASTVPRERAGFALGMLQMGIYSGASVGPWLGGLIFDHVGPQATFWTTSGLLLIGGVLIALLVREDFDRGEAARAGGWRAVLDDFRLVLSSRPLLTTFGVRMMMRAASRLLGPILPLFVQTLAPGGRVATLAGTVQGVSAATGAVGSVLMGWLSDRTERRNILLLCAGASAAIYVPHFFVDSVAGLTLLQAIAGFAMGGVLATLTAAMATLSPEGQQGSVYGVDASVASIANAIGPMLGTGLAVAAGVRAPFLGAAAMFAVTGLITTFLVRPSSPRPLPDADDGQ